MEAKKMFLILIFAIALFSCGKEKVKIEHKYDYVNKDVYEESTEIDFYNFKHYIDSDYAFEIKITNIRVVEHKDAFEIEKEKYGKPEKINGTSVAIEFDMKNPYPKTMRIPFPEYFQIASNEFEGLKGYGYSRNLDIYTNFASIIESDKGIPLNSIGHWNDDPVSRRLIVDFKQNETKSFVIEFTDPFPSTIEKITFIGFNKEFQNIENGGFNLFEYGLLIDLKSKKIVDLISMKM